MEQSSAIDTLAALAQATRLSAFRLLVSHEPAGMPAGEIAKELGTPPNTLSTHLAILERAGLVTSERKSRNVVYRANLARVRALTSFLVSDCCNGRPELCRPLAAEFLFGAGEQERVDARC